MNISGDIRILQWNCCGIRSKLPQLQIIACEADIICIQESILWPNNNFWLKGFKVFRNDITSPNQRGVCMLVRENLTFSNIDLTLFKHPSWEIQGLSLSLVDDSIAVVNLYRHPNLHTPYNMYNQLFTALSNKYHKFIIMGDFNAHHLWWGCGYDDSPGKTLSSAIDAHRLIILNDRLSPTLFHPSANHSIIDLAISSEGSAPCCSSYVHFDTLGSDHFPIFTLVEGNFRLKSMFLYKLKVNSKDLAVLHHSLYSSLDKLKNILLNNYAQAYTILELQIKDHLYSLFPPKSRLPRSSAIRHKPSSPPWWNDKCQIAVEERKKAIREFFKHPSSDSFEAYKRIRLKCSKLLKKQKKLGWQKYCAHFNHKTPTSEVWSLIKSFKRRKLVKPSSTLLSDPGVMSHLIKDTIDKLCPPSCKPLACNSLCTMVSKDEQLDNVNYKLEQPFTDTELRSAIKCLNLNSAPGIDQIDNRVISSLPSEYMDIILSIYNYILIEGSFPNQWKQSLVVLIPKPDANGYRPISLLSCFLKIMEKMVYNRLQWHIESQHIIPDNQFGFRPDRSCVDSLVLFSSDIHKGFAVNSSTIAAFLDIKGAFDNVIPYILIQELESIGIPARIRMFIYNLISDRSLHFVVEGEKYGPFYSYKGTPQGSTLSPLLFDIYIRDINRAAHCDSKILLYADDITVYSTSSNPLKAFSSIQSTISRIADYLRDRGLDLSPSKSCWMLFTRSKTPINFPSLKIYDSIVPKVDSVRFLGITMDSKMTGKGHIRFLVRKGAAIVDILTALAGTWWGSHPQLLLNLYRSIFRGAIEYGCHLFRFNQNKTIFNKLERLQFRAIRIAMGYRISTPCMRKFLTKSLARKFNPVIDSLESMKNTPCNRKKRIYLIQSFPIFRQYLYIHHYRSIVHSIPFLPYFFFDYDTATLEILPCMDMYPVDRDLPNEVINKIFLDKSAPYSTDAVTFFTDGSKINKDLPSGASVYSPDINLNIAHRLPAATSVFTAEAW